MDLVVTLIHGAAIAVFGCAMIYAAVSDLSSFEIPNWLSVTVIILFGVVALVDDGPWSALLGNVITSVAVLAIGFALFAAGYFGAGDIKLMAAIALWTGWPLFIPYLVFMILAGGVLALMLIVFRRYPLHTKLSGTGWLQQLHARKNDLPYAVAIGIAALYFLPQMPIVASFLQR